MAAYLIEPHKLRLSYDPRLQEAIEFACTNRIHIQLWPIGNIVPQRCRRIEERLDITAFGETAQRWAVMDELEVEW
jgi:hypothetical protein